MLNAIGLQNPGVEKFIEEKLPYLRRLNVPLIVSVMGYSTQEFVAVVKRLEQEGGIDGFELNLSCPNVSYGAKAGDRQATMFAHDEGLIQEAMSAVRQVTKKTLIAKLGPDVSDIAKMALAAERGGADGVALINTFMAMVIDVRSRRPVLGNKTGGLSGPCVRPIAVRMTWDVARAVKIPVVGIGGIMNGHDALEFLIAGAAAIQVGTANFMNPTASLDVLRDIEHFMKHEKIASLKEIIGSVKA